MASTALAPAAAAAASDADSGMSNYYASKIGELSAVSCSPRNTALIVMRSIRCATASAAFGALPIIFGVLSDAMQWV